MELSEDNLITLSGYLQQTLSPEVSIRRPAEKFLESVEINKNYPLLILHLVDKNEVELTIRVAGAVAFKNYIKRNWPLDDEGKDRIHQEDRESVKKLIVDLMLHSPESIQKQLSDAVSIIGRHDFPNKWPDLISQMVEKFKTGDFHIINGILHTAHSLFKRYRHEFKSQELWLEIKLVLDKFCQPLTDLFLATMNLTSAHANNPEALKIIYNSLLMISKVFYSLNFQDLPEFFEDNMNTWMSNFHTLLNVDIKCLQSDDESEPGLQEQLKSQICENISLYAQKYDEEFNSLLPQFVTVIWELLMNTGLQPKYDLLVSNSLQFLATVADRNHYRSLFESAEVLANICEKVVIPNMEFRVSDEENFEDNAEEYMRKDIEGSDVDTRRRAACDLVKALSRYFEGQMMDIFGRYIQVMLEQYRATPLQKWRSKDTALYLVASLASRGQTERHGITQTSSLVNLSDFASQHVIPELQSTDINSLPVIKADCIKYIMIFRSILPHDMVVGSLPLIIRHLSASSQVVHTYAACAIEKILALKGPDNKFIVKSEVLTPLAGGMLSDLFRVMTVPGSIEHEENEYVMKAIMRSFQILQEGVIPYLGVLLPKLTEKLSEVSKNPRKPHFNHYLFETLSLSIKIVCNTNPSAVSSFEEALFPIFQQLLQQDVQEFIPYVFQILSLLLEQHSKDTIPEPYMVLFPCLLASVLWNRTGNVHPLVRLLQTFIVNGTKQISSDDKVNALLGIFQKLVASKMNDHEGFYLLQTMVQFLPSEVMAPYMKQIFMVLFQRLSSSKTTKFVKGLLVFFFFYAVKYGAPNLVTMVDDIQNELFGKVVERLMISDIQKIAGTTEKKITAVGLTNILCSCPQVINGNYSKFWLPLLKTLIGLFELPEDTSILPDDHFIEVDETPGYQVAYSQLSFANKKDDDPLEDVVEPRLHLAHSLYKLSMQSPGQLTPILDGLNEEEKTHLKKYLDTANVQLA